MAGPCFKSTTRKCLVVFACFISACLRGIVYTTLPFIYEELLEKFGESASVTAGTISLFTGLTYFLGELSCKQASINNFTFTPKIAFLGYCYASGIQAVPLSPNMNLATALLWDQAYIVNYVRMENSHMHIQQFPIPLENLVSAAICNSIH